MLDEAQHIKNAESQVSRAVRKLKSKKRIALTGTPIENSPDDLWSIMEFLNPGLNGPKDEFRILCQGPDASAVMKRLRPFMLRRTKQMAAPEFPSKTFIPLDIPMSDLQSDLYAGELRRAREAAKSGNSVNILALTRLRQLVIVHLVFLNQLNLTPNFPLAKDLQRLPYFLKRHEIS